MLVGSDDRGADRHQPLDVTGRVGLGLGGPEHPLEGAVFGPPAEAGGSVAHESYRYGHVPPGRSGPELPIDPVEDRAVVQPSAPPLRPRQQRLHEGMHPEITIVWADSAYAGQLVTWAKTYLNLTIKTVGRPKDASGFVVLPRRWVVERSQAWIMRARRHARDDERLIQHSESLITWAAITLMTRRITRRSSRRSGQPASREGERD